MGLFLGAVLGAAVGMEVGDYKETKTCPAERWPCFFGGGQTQVEGEREAVIGTVIGAGVGALIGTMIQTPSWVAIDLTQLAPVRTTAAGALKVGATWRF